MNYQKETVVLVLVILLLYIRPNLLNGVLNTNLGKLLSIVAILFLGNTYGKQYSILFSLVVIVLLYNTVEGMENKDEVKGVPDMEHIEQDDTVTENENNTDEEETNEDTEKMATEEPEKKGKNATTTDQIDNENKLKNIVPSDAPQNNNDVVEGFASMYGSGTHPYSSY